MPVNTGARPWRHLYNRAKWQRLRLRQLQRSPLCRMCADDGRIALATTVDHIKPHKGDEFMFFDSSNLQSLCEAHHNGAKQIQEHKGFIIGHDANGNPIDPAHHWNG